MSKTFKAQVELSTGMSSGSTHLQWVQETAENAYEARLALEAKYGRLIQGPTEEHEQSNGFFYDDW